MTDYIKALMQADESIRRLFVAMVDMLNAPDTDYTIEFKNKKFDFCKPFTKEDKKELDIQKHYVAYLLLYDAFSRLGKQLKKPNRVPKSDDFRTIWFNVANMHRYTSRDATTDTVVSDVAYEVDEDTSKALDLESIYVKVQRKDLSDEDKWNLLLGNIGDKESME